VTGGPHEPWPPPRPEGYDDDTHLSHQEVERRVELRPTPAQPAIPPPTPDRVAAAPVASAPVTRAPVRPARAARPLRADPHRLLWRDSATILVAIVLVLLGAQAFLPRGAGLPTDSAIPSAVVIGSVPPGSSVAPVETFGPIIDPSLGIDATPTPIPVITLGPTHSPTPTPKPNPTPRPTPKPTKTPKPTPTPTPPPVAVLSCSVIDVLTVSCDGTDSVHSTEWVWDWDDLTPNSPGSLVQHVYAVPGTYLITLTVTGLDGVMTNADEQVIDVP
jgi:hypothetical protein